MKNQSCINILTPLERLTHVRGDIYLYTGGNKSLSKWSLAHAVQYKLDAADKLTFSTKLVPN